MIHFYTPKKYPDAKPKKIKVEFPLTIVSDTHNNLKDLRRIIHDNPNIISLGDFTSLFDKEGKFNIHSIQFFKDKKIPTLKGNHEETVQTMDSTLIEHSEFLNQLPIGFKLILPDKTHYLCFHNRPNDLWTFYEKVPSWEEFKEIYPIDSQTRGVIIGHHHFNRKIKYPNFLFYIVGRFQIEKDYIVLDQQGITFKKLE